MADYSGGPGPDSVFGGGADESFDYSQGGADTVWGGGGDDTISFGAAFGAGDQVNGEAGNDVLELQGDYSGGVTFDGVNAYNIETIHFLGFSAPRATLADGIVGTDETLTVINDDTVDRFVLDGRALVHTALDITTGGTADQHVYGGALDDTLTVLHGIDRSNTYDLGDGYDTLHAQGIFGRMAGHTFRNIEAITFAGNASMVMSDGSVAAGESLTITTAAAGSSIVDKHERDGTLHLIGNTGVDGFYAGWGNDTLEGGGGNDSLYGNRGADVMSGGTGADAFIFSKAAQSVRGAADLITDLDNSDTINLSSIDANTTQKDQQHFTLVGSFGHHAGELTFGYDAESGYTRLAGDLDGDARADFVVLIEGDHSDFAGLEL